MPVPSSTRSVWAARNARATSGSRIGSVGSIGDGATRGSGSTTCSPAQSESNPTDSASLATRAAVAGRQQACELVENRPYLSASGM